MTGYATDKPLTHWKKLENPDYIGSYAFQPNEKKTLTISHVRREMVCGADGKKEECTVVSFTENEKPLILNATNGKMISKIAGSPYIEKWAGTRIVLGVEKVKAFGEIVEAVRVKDITPPQPQRATESIPPCADCGKPIEGAGKATAKAIASASQKKFGAALCIECAQRHAAQTIEHATQPEASTEVPENTDGGGMTDENDQN